MNTVSCSGGCNCLKIVETHDKNAVFVPFYTLSTQRILEKYLDESEMHMVGKLVFDKANFSVLSISQYESVHCDVSGFETSGNIIFREN